MDFNIDIGVLAVISLAVGAVVLGIVLQLIGEVRFGYEWIVTSVAAFIGGFVASEWITSFRTVEPVWEKMAILPAIGGLLVVGVIVDVLIRYGTHGSYIRGVPVH